MKASRKEALLLDFQGIAPGRKKIAQASVTSACLENMSEKSPSHVAADVRRRTILRRFGRNPPPHVGGYISQTRSEAYRCSARILLAQFRSFKTINISTHQSSLFAPTIPLSFKTLPDFGVALIEFLADRLIFFPMNKVNVASFNELDEAQSVKERLEQAGIKAEVYDEANLQRFWFIAEPLAGKKVRVAERDFDKAKLTLDKLDTQEDTLHNAVRCPKCNSPRTEYPAATRKFIGPALIEIFCTTAHIMEKQFYCENCQHTWESKVKLEPETDVLGWPVKDTIKPPQA